MHTSRCLARPSPAATGLRCAPLLLMLAAPLTAAPEGVADVFPGATWEERTPAEVGLNADLLGEMAEFAGGRGCVVRHGAMCFTWGDATERGDVASAAKPWYSYFLLRAIEDGKIGSLDDRVVEVEPRLADLNAALDHKDRRITWRHLCTQTSCYEISDRPGEAFDYNDWQMALLIDTLFLNVYGATYDNLDDTVLHPLLTDVLKCQDEPTFMAFGTENRPGRVSVSPRDFARFGLLYLHRGDWNGVRLLSEEHAVMAVTSPLPSDFPRASGEAAEVIEGQRSLGSLEEPDNQCDHLGSYSFLWWINGIDREGVRHWPDVPEDAFGAFGHGGLRAMVVVPSLDLIVSWNDTGIDSREKENHVLSLLVRAAAE